MPVHVFDKLRDMFQIAQPVPNDNEDESNEEEGTMRRIDIETREGLTGDGQGAFGPLAVLLVGYMQDEVEKFRKMMIEMDADTVKIIPCTVALLDGSLQDALESDFPRYEQPPLGQRRAVIMSGMYGSEVVEVVSAYKDEGLPPTVFAAAVPNNYSRIVKELVKEIWADHNTMRQRMQPSQQ